jgi:small-conductance mechanosensitive channel
MPRLLLAAVLTLLPAVARSQSPEDRAKQADDAPAAPQQVDVAPAAEDDEIEARLTRILQATEWFQDPQVQVDEGVAFLRGRTQSQDYKEWAARLAQNTEDVVAVVNRMEVSGRPMWDFTPAAGMWAARRFALFAFRTRINNALLRQMAASAVAIAVLILGVYLVLRVSGLTRLAVTVLGGTGLFGLIVGIVFRGIAENYLASILISMRRPFEIGDLIEVAGNWGIVQAVTTRGTLMITFEGNHIHIPNSMIYKSIIDNYTANPNLRLDFTIGIGYDDPIPLAQEVGVRVLREHPAVLDDPEPLVLVDQLGAATVVLKLLFWVNVREHSMFKVRSAVIRQVKRAFQDAGISLPDEAREVTFPRGVPVRMLSPTAEEDGNGEPKAAQPHPRAGAAAESASSRAEGGLSSEAGAIEDQARHSRLPSAGENLLGPRDESTP